MVLKAKMLKRSSETCLGPSCCYLKTKEDRVLQQVDMVLSETHFGFYQNIG